MSFLSRLAPPFLIGNTLEAVYTVGGGKKSRIKQIILCNNFSATAGVDIYIVPSANFASATNKIFKGIAPGGLFLRPGESKIIDLDIVLETGESVQWISNLNDNVSGRISGLEITGTTPYKRLWAPRLIPSAGTNVILDYPGNAVPAATKVRLREVILMNDNTTLQVVNFHIIPSGSTALLENKLFNASAPYGLTLQPAETKILSLDQILEAGESIAIGSDVLAADGSGNNKVSCRGSGLEVT